MKRVIELAHYISQHESCVRDHYKSISVDHTLRARSGFIRCSEAYWQSATVTKDGSEDKRRASSVLDKQGEEMLKRRAD